MPRTLCLLAGLLVVVSSAPAQAPLWQQNYAELDALLKTRRSQFPHVSIGSEMSYWARLHEGAYEGVRIADLGATGAQQLAVRCLALSYARDVREYYAILSLLRFHNGQICWTHANLELEDDTIPNNSWLIARSGNFDHFFPDILTTSALVARGLIAARDLSP